MTRIHPTAIVDPDAEIGPEVEIGPFAVIERDVRIGEGTTVAAHAVVRRYVSIGRGNRIHEYASIGGVPQDVTFHPCESWVEIGDENVIREHVTIHRGHREGHVTRIGDRNYLMVNAHVAHDCVIGNGVIFANNATLAGHVTIHDRAFLSGNLAVHQFVQIGRYAMVSGLAKVVQDCLPFLISSGQPARAVGLNIVGLRRAGFPREEIKAIKDAYRTLFRSGLGLQEALARLDESPSPSAREMAQFIRASRRGFAHEATGARSKRLSAGEE